MIQGTTLDRSSRDSRTDLFRCGRAFSSCQVVFLRKMFLKKGGRGESRIFRSVSVFQVSERQVKVRA